MAAVAVGDVFEDEGTVTGDSVLFSVLDGGFDCKYIHTVNFEAGNILTAFVIVG